MTIFVTDGSTGYNSSPGAATQAAGEVSTFMPGADAKELFVRKDQRREGWEVKIL